MSAVIDALLGPIGGLVAGIAAILGALILGRWQGASGERERRSGQDARDYRDERQKIDTQDLGIGASDSERVDRLRDIAKRRR
jgi:hypothetical protein